MDALNIGRRRMVNHAGHSDGQLPNKYVGHAGVMGDKTAEAGFPAAIILHKVYQLRITFH